MPTAYVYHEICKSLYKKVLKHMSLSKLLWSTYQVFPGESIHTIHSTQYTYRIFCNNKSNFFACFLQFERMVKDGL